MKKLTQSDIQKITEAQKLIQELQKKQSLIYDTLLVNLPTLKKEEESQIFNFVFNFESDIDENATEEDCKKAFEKFLNNRFETFDGE